MRLLTPIALCALAVLMGCGQDNSPETPQVNKNTAPENELMTVSFEEGDQAVIEVPGMHCPHACYPAVKETVAGVEGVESVELVDAENQENAAEIKDRRIILTFNDSVDGKKIAQELEDAGFPARGVAEWTPEANDDKETPVTDGEEAATDADAEETDSEDEQPAVKVEVENEVEETEEAVEAEVEETTAS